MLLFDLPLVLVQDIIEQIVLSYETDDLFDLFELRLVNGLFEREVIKHFARHRFWLCQPHHIKYCVPHGLAVRLIREHLGVDCRRDSPSGRLIHGAVDFITDHLRSHGQSVERGVVLEDVCEALLRGDYLEILVEHVEPRKRKPRRKPCRAPTQKEVYSTAFALVVVMQYHQVEEAMLSAGLVNVNPPQSRYTFTRPIDRAIRLGYLQSVQRLLDAGATLLDEGFLGNLQPTFGQAAKAGFAEVIDLVLCRPEMDVHWASLVIDYAAEFNQWNIATTYLEKYGESLPESLRKSVLCWASRYGRNDIILKTMEYDVRPRNQKVFGCRRYPLREAVRGGHPSTVQLLLDNGALGDDVESHVDVLARYAAQGGNLDVLEVLRNQYFWRSSAECHVLPFAADRGHLDFAKAVMHCQQGCCKNKSVPDCKGTFFDNMLYFSLLRAVVSGHEDVVRWLVDDIGVDVDNKEEIGQVLISDGMPQLTPLVLAAAVGNAQMARLLVQQLGATPLDEDYEWSTHGAQSPDWLLRYRIRLSLGKGFSTTHGNGTRMAVQAALCEARRPRIRGMD